LTNVCGHPYSLQIRSQGLEVGPPVAGLEFAVLLRLHAETPAT